MVLIDLEASLEQEADMLHTISILGLKEKKISGGWNAQGSRKLASTVDPEEYSYSQYSPV